MTKNIEVDPRIAQVVAELPGLGIITVPEDNSYFINADLETEKLTNLSQPTLTLQQRSLLALVVRLSFSSDFSDPVTLREQLTKLTTLFPSVEELTIQKTYQESGNNRITTDFDFSPLGRFRRLSSLDLPVTAVSD